MRKMERRRQFVGAYLEIKIYKKYFMMKGLADMSCVSLKQQRCAMRVHGKEVLSSRRKELEKVVHANEFTAQKEEERFTGDKEESCNASPSKGEAMHVHD
jgi:hypothetical protein